MGKTNFLLSTMPFNPWAVLATCRNSSINTGKMNLKPVLNKTSPQAHIESELKMLGIPRKLVKYVVHSFKKNKIEKKYFSSHKLPKLQSTNFWTQGILGVNPSSIRPFALSPCFNFIQTDFNKFS
jgi:hypothetical protein